MMGAENGVIAGEKWEAGCTVHSLEEGDTRACLFADTDAPKGRVT